MASGAQFLSDPAFNFFSDNRFTHRVDFSADGDYRRGNDAKLFDFGRAVSQHPEFNLTRKFLRNLVYQLFGFAARSAFGRALYDCDDKHVNSPVSADSGLGTIRASKYVSEVLRMSF